ncbi:calcium/sodium antiporter [Pseudomonas sp. KU26590]|uniref:calcium/sodium antiporter n=1 Tax=Pseudomonas sp. KU26590 TaxID=2991051 RepID=UPI00223D3B5E|nr:calcium/sodium antiporter [Pseudomonas sp. KU26590]UZJ62900.1 calcium/sodium antiporter [Pseudomonas sp. KU26590]
MIIGAQVSVRAAVALAALLKTRPLFLGLTVVALGSSAPQLAVGLQAAFTDSTDIAVGSVIGSNIFNVLVTLGLSALIIPLRVARQLVRVDLPLMIAATALVAALAWNGELSGLDGVVLLLGMAAYLFVVVRQFAHGARHVPRTDLEPRRRLWPLLGRLALMACGLALLTLGSHLLVSAAVSVALDLGLSERVIGLTVIAVATSLPALMTSLVAALRGERDIAVGNIIGSNLFNLLGVLGITALISTGPLSISPNALDFDLPVMLGVAALCVPLFYSGYRITRLEGLLLLGLYAVYGLHIVSFTTGMPLAERLERLMIHYALPVIALCVVVGTVRAWRRQH